MIPVGAILTLEPLINKLDRGQLVNAANKGVEVSNNKIVEDHPVGCYHYQNSLTTKEDHPANSGCNWASMTIYSLKKFITLLHTIHNGHSVITKA